MAIIKNINNNKNNKHLWIYGENCNLCIVVGTYNQATSVENSVMSPQKTKCRIIYDNSTPKYILKQTESMDSNRYLYTDVLRSTIHNSWKVETIQMTSMDKQWIDKWNTVCAYNLAIIPP